MPYIAVRVLRGITLEQKRALARDITEVVAKDLGCSPQAVVIELEEFAPGSISGSGQPPARAAG
jgi:4-oxalocrotonate tautomerase family enzyme